MVAASASAPYVGLTVDLDPLMVADIALDLPPARRPEDDTAIASGALDGALLDPLTRLVRLLDEPSAAAALAPLANRELHYRLLTGPHGPLLRRLAGGDGRLSEVASAARWIREHYAEPISIEDLARHSAMSQTSFHRHFKAATALTPMRYRTRIRLQEARRLMLSEELDATSIGLAVGYESHSQVSREYRRMFGAPPGTDAARLRAEVAELAAA